MPESVFHFKEFSVHQDRCAMKVGTDGVLLGAWTNALDCKRVLDIGTGTGLIALMIAQRHHCIIDAIDIDLPAVEQARDNVEASPWADRITVIHQDLSVFNPVYKYDLIVSNPPYFIDSYTANGEARHNARSASASLSHDELLIGIIRLLNAKGRFSLILPGREGQLFREQAGKSGFYCNKMVKVSTGRDKPVKRILMEFSRINSGFTEEDLTIHYQEREFTDAYKKLTGDFYMSF